MKNLSLYEPAMCCSTGVCGPSVDPALVQLSADLEWLKKQGISVTRYNLSQQPADFAANTSVRDSLQRVGQDCLPLVYADGELIASRFYPDRKQLAKVFGLQTETDSACDQGNGCCE